MEVTSAVRTVGFLHSHSHSSHVESLNTRAFFISTRIRGRRKVHVPYDYHHPNHFSNDGRQSHSSSSSSNGIFIINSTSATASTTAETYGAAESLSEVEKIKQRCLTWQWKGQYSINYFVSSDADSPQQQQPPPLLVHGFGASIPHWRRNIKTLVQNYTVYAIDLIGSLACVIAASVSNQIQVKLLLEESFC